MKPVYTLHAAISPLNWEENKCLVYWHITDQTGVKVASGASSTGDYILLNARLVLGEVDPTTLGFLKWDIN